MIAFQSHSVADHKTRIERYKKKWTYSDAFTYLSEFYTDKDKASIASENFKSGLSFLVRNLKCQLRT